MLRLEALPGAAGEGLESAGADGELVAPPHEQRPMAAAIKPSTAALWRESMGVS
jgi:hypothetical protein